MGEGPNLFPERRMRRTPAEAPNGGMNEPPMSPITTSTSKAVWISVRRASSTPAPVVPATRFPSRLLTRMPHQTWTRELKRHVTGRDLFERELGKPKGLLLLLRAPRAR